MNSLDLGNAGLCRHIRLSSGRVFSDTICPVRA